MAMNERFWFMTFRPSAGIADCHLVQTALSIVDEPAPSSAIAVEIIGSDSSCWSVFVSTADSTDDPRVLHCLFGLSNDPIRCNDEARFGLPLIDAQITFDGDELIVTADVYTPRADGAPSTPEPRWLMRIANLQEAATNRHASASLGARYRQLVATPDVARPNRELVGQFVDSTPTRNDIRRVEPSGVAVSFNSDVLYPDLFRLSTASAVSPVNVWMGEAGTWYPIPTMASSLYSEASSRSAARPLKRIDRSSVFGSPSFLFEDLEIVGFRTDLPAREHVHTLIQALNFHLEEGQSDFRYREATATVVIELLRYGKMRTRNPGPPFEADDFMSQHELLARVLVGRVDDDTSQARDAAMFVPAIFVDNPWSKVVGRRLQGFPKELVEFRAAGVALDMTGRAKTGERELVPLHAVSEVHLVAGPSSHQPTQILSMSCPDDIDGSASQFFTPPPLSLLATTLFRRAPFDQFDFFGEFDGQEAVEFRRSFARGVLADGFSGYRSVQVAPVDELPVGGMALPKAWITGRCTLDNLEVAFPTGVATLRLEDPPAAPLPWKRLRAALGGAGLVSFPTGDWYRLRCSMELEIDDALAW
jgi:hypothetical protein